uniref:Hexosyltransferase n=1 Tax=Nelumbo nucifera TaxID=4432 RepID=A0A822ZA97_NELNU|nr:TPA_asm: hypothetical protein HUJ06_014279 [Nelumbo nucifera]
MRGAVGTLPSPVEARHRLSGSIDDTNKRRFQRNKDFKDVEKHFQVSIQDRNRNCKFLSLKLVLVIIIFGTFLTFLHSPAVYNEYQSDSGSRPSFVDRWIWERPVIDPRYVSYVDVNWDQITQTIGRLPDRNGHQTIGLLNFNDSEIDQWKKLIPSAKHAVLHLKYADKNVTWESLYPEWIDEEEESEVPICPSLPEPGVSKTPRLDLIAVKLPCNRSGEWSRDVARLHLQLAAARFAAFAKGYHPVHVLIITDCFPIPNLFTCKDLIVREGNAWLYKPNLSALREKLGLPVGSCELALPLKAKGCRFYWSVIFLMQLRLYIMVIDVNVNHDERVERGHLFLLPTLHVDINGVLDHQVLSPNNHLISLLVK